MPTLKEAAVEFLAQKRIAVTGVSRKADVAANGIYKKLRSEGHEMFAVNPNAETVEGDACYPSLGAIPGGVDAVVIASPAHTAAAIVRECSALGIRRVWMHRGMGAGSVDDEAVRLCSEHGISVIPGSCPMMFCTSADPFHACMRWITHTFGKDVRPLP